MTKDATTQAGDKPQVNLDRETVAWRLQAGDPCFVAAWMKLSEQVLALRKAGTLILN